MQKIMVSNCFQKSSNPNSGQLIWYESKELIEHDEMLFNQKESKTNLFELNISSRGEFITDEPLFLTKRKFKSVHSNSNNINQEGLNKSTCSEIKIFDRKSCEITSDNGNGIFKNQMADCLLRLEEKLATLRKRITILEKLIEQRFEIKETKIGGLERIKIKGIGGQKEKENKEGEEEDEEDQQQQVHLRAMVLFVDENENDNNIISERARANNGTFTKSLNSLVCFAWPIAILFVMNKCCSPLN